MAPKDHVTQLTQAFAQRALQLAILWAVRLVEVRGGMHKGVPTKGSTKMLGRERQGCIGETAEFVKKNFFLKKRRWEWGSLFRR